MSIHMVFWEMRPQETVTYVFLVSNVLQKWRLFRHPIQGLHHNLHWFLVRLYALNMYQSHSVLDPTRPLRYFLETNQICLQISDLATCNRRFDTWFECCVHEQLEHISIPVDSGQRCPNWRAEFLCFCQIQSLNHRWNPKVDFAQESQRKQKDKKYHEAWIKTALIFFAGFLRHKLFVCIVCNCGLYTTKLLGDKGTYLHLYMHYTWTAPNYLLIYVECFLVVTHYRVSMILSLNHFS